MRLKEKKTTFKDPFLPDLEVVIYRCSEKNVFWKIFAKFTGKKDWKPKVENDWFYRY